MKIEILNKSSQSIMESRIRNIAAAGKLSRFPGNVFEVLDNCQDNENNLKLIKRIIKMGHKSIIEHDYIVFGLCDVTPIIEQIIIGYRLTSFTIKSRREVDFRNVGFYIPNFRDNKLKAHKKNKELQEEYKNHMQFLFNTYGDLVDNNINVEDARFLLPYSYYSNIIMGLNARELEKMIISFKYGYLSNITEVRELGDILFELVKEHMPYLIESIEENKISAKNGFEYLESNSTRDKIEIAEKTKLISHTPDADDIVLESLIMYHYQCSKDVAKNKLQKLVEKDVDAKSLLMKELMNKEENRELEQVNFTFQIPISLSILTHLTRHRMHSLLVPEFLPLWDFDNYIKPTSIKGDLARIYDETVRLNIKVMEKFKKENVAEEDLIYFYLGNQMVNVLTTMNARNIRWITRLRSCNKAQWQIRYISQDIVKLVSDVAPLIGENLGPTCITNNYCGEGKECCGLINKLKRSN